MIAALTLSAIAMTLIVGVRYLIASGAFAWATKRRHPELYTGLDAQIAREIRWSLLAALIFSFFGTIYLAGTLMTGVPQARTLVQSITRRLRR